MLNHIQRKILDDTVSFHLEALRESDPRIAILALESIGDFQMYEKAQETLKNHGLLEDVDSFRKIFQHPYPQNRTSSGIFPPDAEAGYVYFIDDQGNKLKEPQGLFGLTGRNDNTALPVTRPDVISFFNLLINAESEVQNVRFQDFERAKGLIEKTKKELDKTQNILSNTEEELKKTSDGLRTIQERLKGKEEELEKKSNHVRTIEERLRGKEEVNESKDTIIGSQNMQDTIHTSNNNNDDDEVRVINYIDRLRGTLVKQADTITENKDKIELLEAELDVYLNMLSVQDKPKLSLGDKGNYRSIPKENKVFNLGIRNDKADQTYNEKCDTGMKVGGYIFKAGMLGLGAALAVVAAPIVLPTGALAAASTAVATASSFIPVAVTTAASTYIPATITTAAVAKASLGTAAVGSAIYEGGNFSRQVGRNGKYRDLFEMAKRSMGYEAKLAIQDFESALQHEVIEKIKSSAIKLLPNTVTDPNLNDLEKKAVRKELLETVDAILNFKEDIPITKYSDFNDGIYNATKIINDLNTLWAVKKQAVDDASKNNSKVIKMREDFEMQYFKNKKTCDKFLNLTIEVQEHIINCVAGVIIDTLNSVQDCLKNNKPAAVLHLMVRNAQVESCHIL